MQLLKCDFGLLSVVVIYFYSLCQAVHSNSMDDLFDLINKEGKE